MNTATPTRTIHTAHDLDELWIGSVALTFDGLAWQANSTSDGGNIWTSTVLGETRSVTSDELIAANQGHPVTVIFNVETDQTK